MALNAALLVHGEDPQQSCSTDRQDGVDQEGGVVGNRGDDSGNAEDETRTTCWSFG